MDTERYKRFLRRKGENLLEFLFIKKGRNGQNRELLNLTLLYKKHYL